MQTWAVGTALVLETESLARGHRVFEAVVLTGLRGHGTLGSASNPLRMVKEERGLPTC